MNIHVGSKNPIKIGAVKEALSRYDQFKDVLVESVIVESGVSDQPKTMDETFLGAINRAKAAFPGSELSFGLESGLTKVPYTKSGYMDFCACAIFDGKDVHVGMSPAYEYPKKVVKLVFEKGMNINDAFYTVGLTDNLKIGQREGALGILTKGRVTRKEYTIQSVLMALIPLLKD